MADGSRGAERYNDYVEAFAADVIKQLEQGTAPWQKPWEAGVASGLPYNPTTGKAYSGCNVPALMAAKLARGFEDDRWLTYKQAKTLGAQVRQGEEHIKGVKYVDVLSKKDKESTEIIDPDDKAQRLRIPIVFPLFNAEQCDGMPPLIIREPPTEKQRHEACEKLLAESGALIEHDGRDRAYYQPSSDSIHLPDRSAFKTADGYYATALHELGHWTGHPSRLARNLTGGFGSEQYAKEELRAEIASWMMGDKLSIGHDPGQHAAYVGSWIKAIKNDPKEIMRACADAEKICKHLQVAKYEQVLKPEQAQEQKRPVSAPNLEEGARAAAEAARKVQRSQSHGVSLTL